MISFFENAIFRWQGSGGTMEAPLVRGMAYVTAKYQNLTPKIKTIHAITKVNGRSANGARLGGDKFTFEMNNGQTWKLYTSTHVTIYFQTSQITFEGRFSGSVRLAIVPDHAAAALLDQHSRKVPKGGSISAQSSSGGKSATYKFNFKTEGSGNLLMLALPHHQQTLSQALRNEFKLDTIKGKMVGVVGETWSLTEKLSSIAWNAPRSIPADKKEIIRNALKGDIHQRVTAKDTYFSGKQMSLIGRLALIADELGETGLAQTYRTNLKRYMEPYLRTNNGKLVYDRSWGGVVDSAGINDKGANFGFGYYNDHHFHLGYFVYAAACIAKADQGWANQYQNAIMALIRDYANPALGSGDPHFPFMRNKDWFDGHSWAAGLFEFGDSRNQESTSEAVNAWYAIALYGLATGNNRLKDLGRLAMATELRTTHLYWQIDSSDGIYPSPYTDNKVVGILWGTKVDYATFFGGNTEYIHGIQYLPFTPITEELLEKKWIQEEYPIVRTAIQSAKVGWKGFIYMAHAVIDPAVAWQEVQTLYGYDDGNTKTNTLYWVATRPGLGGIANSTNGFC